METSSIKTIAAFLNARHGGTLLIGVANDGTIYGLDADYTSLGNKIKDPRDRFLLHLANILSVAVGDAAATNVRAKIHTVEGRDVCRVQVDPCGFPVDATVIYQKPNGPKETRTEFFVRRLSSTVALDPVEKDRYIFGRWRGTSNAS